MSARVRELGRWQRTETWQTDDSDGDQVRVTTHTRTFTTGIVYDTSWASIGSLIGALQQSQQQTTYSDVQALRTEFQRRLNLNSGKCKEKLNELLGALGKKFDDQASKTTGIEALAERFLGGQKGYQLLSGTSDASYGGEYGDGKISFRANNSIGADGFNFIHELTHAAGGKSGFGFSHQRIVESIAKIEGLNLDSFQEGLQAEAKSKGLKGDDKRGFIDDKYSNRLNWFIGNYCEKTGGDPRWQGFVQQYSN